MTHWHLKDLFPILDVLRWSCSKTPLPAAAATDILDLILDRKMIDAAGPESVARLALRLLSNFFLFDGCRSLLRDRHRSEECVGRISGLIESGPSGRDHLELAATAVIYNFAVSLADNFDQELAFQVPILRSLENYFWGHAFISPILHTANS
jgi:hypothetical protein